MFHPADGENSGASLGGSVLRNGITTPQGPGNQSAFDPQDPERDPSDARCVRGSLERLKYGGPTEGIALILCIENFCNRPHVTKVLENVVDMSVVSKWCIGH